MVASRPLDEAGGMTEPTTGPTTEQAPEQAPEQPPRSGWNTENLKDYRRLRRSRTDRKLAGVAGGLGEHLDVDPTIIRVLFVVLAFFGGAGIVAYGALWLIVPEEGTEDAVVHTSESTRNGLLVAVAVIAGVLALSDTWNGFSFPFFWFPWPLAVVALVVAIVLLSKDRGSSTPYAGPTTPPPPYAPAASFTASHPTAPAGPVPPAPPQGAAPWYPPTPPPPYVPPRPRRRGPILFGITVALIALALGALGLYDASGADVVDAAYPALALGVVGLILLLGAFWGRPGGLIALGLVSALVLAVFSIGQPTFRGDRDVRVSPEHASDVQDGYTVPAGRIVVDLSRVKDPQNLDGRVIDVSANAGELVVILPEGVATDLDAAVDFGGRIDSPIATRDGWGTSVQGRVGPQNADTVVDLEMNLQFGRIVVNQP